MCSASIYFCVILWTRHLKDIGYLIHIIEVPKYNQEEFNLGLGCMKYVGKRSE